MTIPTTLASILLVDDAASLRVALRAFFTSEGYAVVGELGSGAGVLEAVQQLHPDIVCLDYHLPDSNGLDLLKAIHEADPEVAVVMITGDADTDLEAHAAENGAAGFIRKPFTQGRMAMEIRQVVMAQAMHRERRARGPFAVEQARARAVVADDSATMRMLLSAILNQAAVYVAGEAADGRQAIERVAQCQPDIVCLDMDMPVMNGLDALVEIRRACPAAKVLMITGHAGREAVQEAARRGARGYILKPFDPAKVVEAVGRLLEL